MRKAEAERDKIGKARETVVSGWEKGLHCRLSPGNGAASAMAASQSAGSVILAPSHAPRSTGSRRVHNQALLVQLRRGRPRGVRSTCLYQLELARAAMLPASSCTCDLSVVGTSSSLHRPKPYSRAALTGLGERNGLTLISADSPLSSSWSMLGGAEAREPRRGTYQRAPPPGSDPRHSRPHPLSA